MKKLIYAVLGILVLLVVAVVAAPFFVSTEAITSRIVAEVKDRAPGAEFGRSTRTRRIGRALDPDRSCSTSS
jgi:hypothetical protein